jgi:hypothetical protein
MGQTLALPKYPLKYLPKKASLTNFEASKPFIRKNTATKKNVVFKNNNSSNNQINNQINNQTNSQIISSPFNKNTLKSSTTSLIPWGTGEAKSILGPNAKELRKKITKAKSFQDFNVPLRKWIERSNLVFDENKVFNALKRKLTKKLTSYQEFPGLQDDVWNKNIYAALYPTNVDSLAIINESKTKYFLKRLQDIVIAKIRTKKNLKPSNLNNDPDVVKAKKLKLDNFDDIDDLKTKFPSLLDDEDTKKLDAIVNEKNLIPLENSETVLEAEGAMSRAPVKKRTFRFRGNTTTDEILGSNVQEFTNTMVKAKIYRDFNPSTQQWEINPEIKAQQDKINRKSQYNSLQSAIKNALKANVKMDTFQPLGNLKPPIWDESVFCAVFPQTEYALQKINDRKLNPLRAFMYIKLSGEDQPDANTLKALKEKHGAEFSKLTSENFKNPDFNKYPFLNDANNKAELEQLFKQIKPETLEEQGIEQKEQQGGKKTRKKRMKKKIL